MLFNNLLFPCPNLPYIHVQTMAFKIIANLIISIKSMDVIFLGINLFFDFFCLFILLWMAIRLFYDSWNSVVTNTWKIWHNFILYSLLNKSPAYNLMATGLIFLSGNPNRNTQLKPKQYEKIGLIWSYYPSSKCPII